MKNFLARIMDGFPKRGAQAAPAVPEASADNVAVLERVEDRLASSSGGMTMKELLEGAPDEFFLWLLTEGRDRVRDEGLRAMLPGMPDERTQIVFNAKAGRDALDQAFKAFRLFKDTARGFSVDLRECGNVMDFGCGWGRILRFFLKDVEPCRLYGVDVQERVLDACRSCGIEANLSVIDPMPPADFEDGMFDVIYLFSVFSHLSENACRAWMTEFRRILKPGGIVMATTRPRSFIVYCDNLRQREGITGTSVSKAFLDTERTLADYDEGRFCHTPTGTASGDLDSSYYGETAMPESYVIDTWSGAFAEVRFITEQEHGLLGHNLIVARKA